MCVPDGLLFNCIMKDWFSNHSYIVTSTKLAGLTTNGVLLNILYSNIDLLVIGFLLSAINFIFLFFGQRVAKDYAGAGVIVNYFILNILGLISILFSFIK